ncbi:MAG: GTP pyrophosphokinase family protein [Clostridia bacterium]|nr:GTP pyrophosphokinase family protein [Clostridia bacterium]
MVESNGNKSSGIDFIVELQGQDSSIPDDIDNIVSLIGKEKLEVFAKYREMRMMYACAIKEIETKFEVLSSEFGVRTLRNPIESISTRLKSNASIIKKMKNNCVEMTLESMRKNIRDIAGVRVICSYIDDIYTLADALKSQSDITVIEEKDYIKKPKTTGYRSLHLVVSVPVFFANNKTDMMVEVQIRTIAMNFWASLEHEIKYKRKTADDDEISLGLRSCAETIFELDKRMLSLRRLADERYALNENESLMQRLSRGYLEN